MTNKRIIKRKNKALNIFAEGGPVGSLTSGLSTDVSKITKLGQGGASGSIGMQSMGNSGGGLNLGSIGAIGSAAGSMLSAGLSNAQIADTSGIEEDIKSQKNMVVGASSNDELMNEWGSWNKSKDNYSWKDVRGGSNGQRAATTLGAIGSGASSGASVGGSVGAVVGGVVGLGSALAGWFTGNRKAKKKARKLNQQASEANERALSSFETKAENIDTQNDFNLLANYAAYGGFIPSFGSAAIDYELANKELNNKQLDIMSKFKLPSMPNSFEESEFNADVFAEGGGIHIKKKNRGKFTEYCGGKVTSECIARGKKSSNPTTRKRATFAANARKWHANGGYLNENQAPELLYQGAYNSLTTHPDALTNGGVFSNGVTIIGEGGKHEENPLTGVPMGIAPDGKPNLVEEGEVIFNDYVFSNRLHPNEKILGQVNLPSKYKDNTFASIAEKINKEPSERPNDPISKRGLLANMSKLMQAQEEIKSKKEARTEGTKFADGGPYKTYSNYDKINDDWYSDEYMGFINSLQEGEPNSMNWLGRINSGEFGPIGGNQFTDIGDIKRLATDRKKGPVHNAMLAASKEYAGQPDLSFIEDEPYDLPTTPQDIVTPESPTPSNSSTTDSPVESNSSSNRRGLGLDALRYAPALGAGLGVVSDLLGWSNKPDYSNADMIIEASSGLPNIEANPIGNYLSYNPFDRDFYINKLNQQSSATRRAIQNTSGGNRLNAQAGILASDYNYGNSLGDLARQAEEYNLGQRERVEAFNRGTNQYNSESAMRAAMANQANREMQLRGVMAAAQMREEAAGRSSAAKSANLTNFFDSLGDIGREEFSRNMIESNPALGYSIDRRGRVNYKNKKKSKGGYLKYGK